VRQNVSVNGYALLFPLSPPYCEFTNCIQDEEDAEMDVDEMGSDDEMDEEEMDIDDGEGRSPPKRAKGNSGAVLARGRQPRTNRQLAGLRDNMQASKALKLRNLGQRERNYHAKAGESDRKIQTKMVRWDLDAITQRLMCGVSFCSPSTYSRANGKLGRPTGDNWLYPPFLSSCFLFLYERICSNILLPFFLFRIYTVRVTGWCQIWRGCYGDPRVYRLFLALVRCGRNDRSI
jgi:hypothetical protein